MFWKLIFVITLFLSCCSAQKRDWSAVDKILLDAIEDGAFPGAVAVIGDATGVLYSKSFGHFTYNTTSPKMTLIVIQKQRELILVESI